MVSHVAASAVVVEWCDTLVSKDVGVLHWDWDNLFLSHVWELCTGLKCILHSPLKIVDGFGLPSSEKPKTSENNQPHGNNWTTYWGLGRECPGFLPDLGAFGRTERAAWQDWRDIAKSVLGILCLCILLHYVDLGCLHRSWDWNRNKRNCSSCSSVLVSFPSEVADWVSFPAEVADWGLSSFVRCLCINVRTCVAPLLRSSWGHIHRRAMPMTLLNLVLDLLACELEPYHGITYGCWQQGLTPPMQVDNSHMTVHRSQRRVPSIGFCRRSMTKET